MSFNLEKSKFTNHEPAESINELLNFLKDTYNEDQVFRGQTCHYGNLLPSGYRSVADYETINSPAIKIDHEKLKNNLLEIDKIKIKQLSSLISFYGRGLGNILAQQYGLTSEGTDITMNPDVAAFFATKKYPRYTHYSGTDENRLGVIYRFNILSRDYISNLAGLDLTLSLIGNHTNEHGHVWFMKYTKRDDLSSSEIEDFEKEKLQHGQLYTHPAIVPYRSINRILKEFYEDKKHWIYKDDCTDNIKQAIQLYRNLPKSRIARQEGGVIVPPKIWYCSVPYPIRIKYVDRFKLNIYTPSIAVANKLMGVENLIKYPYLETFYFKHSSQRVDTYTPEFLWPSIEEDPIFNFLAYNAISSNKDYFDSHGVDVFDRDKGVLDRGYYN